MAFLAGDIEDENIHDLEYAEAFQKSIEYEGHCYSVFGYGFNDISTARAYYTRVSGEIPFSYVMVYEISNEKGAKLFMENKCMRRMALLLLMSIVMTITGTFAGVAEKERIKVKVGDQEVDMEFSLPDEENIVQIEINPTHEEWLNMLDTAFPDKEDALEDLFCALGLIDMLQECGGDKSNDELHGYLEEIGFSGELYDSVDAEKEGYKFSDNIWMELTYRDEDRYTDATLFISAFDAQHNEIEHFEILVQF